MSNTDGLPIPRGFKAQCQFFGLWAEVWAEYDIARKAAGGDADKKLWGELQVRYRARLHELRDEKQARESTPALLRLAALRKLAEKVDNAAGVEQPALVSWALNNLSVDPATINPATVPARGAVELLIYCQENPKFKERFLAELLRAPRMAKDVGIKPSKQAARGRIGELLSKLSAAPAEESGGESTISSRPA